MKKYIILVMALAAVFTTSAFADTWILSNITFPNKKPDRATWNTINDNYKIGASFNGSWNNTESTHGSIRVTYNNVYATSTHTQSGITCTYQGVQSFHQANGTVNCTNLGVGNWSANIIHT